MAVSFVGKRTLIGLGAMGAGATAALLGGRLLRASVRRTIYPVPPPVAVVAPAGGEILESVGPDPVQILHVPAVDGRRTVVYLHGNGDQIGTSQAVVSAITATGLGVACVEYPGYGRGHGQRTSEARIIAACSAALETLSRTRGLGPGRVVLAGHSLGTVFAAELARRGYADRLVLASPLTSAAAVVRLVGRWLPARLLLGDERLDTLGHASEIDVPTLVIHGTDDESLPFAMGRELAAALPRGRFVALPGRGHDGIAQELAAACAAVAADEA